MPTGRSSANCQTTGIGRAHRYRRARASIDEGAARLPSSAPLSTHIVRRAHVHDTQLRRRRQRLARAAAHRGQCTCDCGVHAVNFFAFASSSRQTSVSAPVGLQRTADASQRPVRCNTVFSSMSKAAPESVQCEPKACTRRMGAF